MGFFCPTWTSADVSYLLPGRVSEDTDKIQATQKSISDKDKDTETPVSSVSFATVSKILPTPAKKCKYGCGV